MKSIYFSTTLAVVLLSLFVVSAFGAGNYPPGPGVTPAVPTVPQPPILLVQGKQVSGSLSFSYPDGRPVTLAEPAVMKVRACSSAGCIVITVTLTSIGDGIYTYALDTTVPGFPTGDVTLYIVADSIRDELGTPFPGTDTLVGTVMVSSPAPEGPNSPVQPASNNKPPSVFLDPEAATEESTISKFSPNAIPLVVALLVIVGAALILLPRRRQ